MPPAADIAKNIGDVRRRIDAAAQRSGRESSSITLIAVSKTFTADDVRAASTAGQAHFGENRVQEGLDKIDALKDLGLTWHLIGHLQSNKAKKAAAAFAWIQSIDSVDLLKRIDAGAVEHGTRPKVLVQADLANEATKFGADASKVGGLVKAALDARAIDLRGLMIVPPIPETPDASRPWFKRLRDLRDELVAAGTPAARLAELSMGMSDDFEVAVEEGATIVRVGSAIFGRRAYPQA